MTHPAPIQVFLRDLILENCADSTNVIIASDNASPELPLKALLQNRRKPRGENSHWSFSTSASSLDSTASQVSRWESIPNLDSEPCTIKAKQREKSPSLPRRTSEKEPLLLELMARTKTVAGGMNDM